MSEPLKSKLVESLVRQGSQKEGAPVLPHWINEGSQLSYVSERAGRAFDVIVQGISHSKKEVRFVFASDRKAWKAVAFDQIIAGRNPLQPRELAEKPTAVPKASPDVPKDDIEGALNALEAKWKSAASACEKQKRGAADAFGPTVNKVPRAWERPEVLDIDSSPERATSAMVQDLDAPDAAEAPQAEDPDPYGLEGSVFARAVAALDAKAGRVGGPPADTEEAAEGRTARRGGQRIPGEQEPRGRALEPNGGVPRGRRGDERKPAAKIDCEQRPDKGQRAGERGSRSRRRGRSRPGGSTGRSRSGRGRSSRARSRSRSRGRARARTRSAGRRAPRARKRSARRSSSDSL